MKQKIIVTNCEISPVLKRRLVKAVDHDRFLNDRDLKPDDLKRVEVMLVDIIGKNGRELIARAADMPGLKLIQSVRAGADSVDFGLIPEAVVYCGNVGAYSLPMGEFTMGMILYLAKYLSLRNEKLKIGKGEYRNSDLLRGKTIGIIGAGGIGMEVARLAKSFGMKALGVNRSGRLTAFFDKVYGHSGIDSVLKLSDVVVLSLPLTVNTFHTIDSRRLRLMKKNCILVNVGRGYLIDERALYKHLKKNPEFRCALDVWWRYPKQGEKFVQRFPFFELPNFLGTPHVSGFVPEEREIAINSALDNIQRFVKGRKLRGIIRREDYLGLREMIRKTS